MSSAVQFVNPPNRSRTQLFPVTPVCACAWRTPITMQRRKPNVTKERNARVNRDDGTSKRSTVFSCRLDCAVCCSVTAQRYLRSKLLKELIGCAKENGRAQPKKPSAECYAVVLHAATRTFALGRGTRGASRVVR